jgi:hypothetical protein
MVMTRDQAINRWKDVVSTVFWAEESISAEWDSKLKAAPNMTHEEQMKFADNYCEAIATEIVSSTTDEQLAAIE